MNTSRATYYLTVDDGEVLRDFEYAHLERALAEAKRHWTDGGCFSVRVYRYSRDGANCIDFYNKERS